MADREFVFGNPEVQKLIIEKFVPLAMDDFYLRRQDDTAGRFFRRVADQGPRKGKGGATRQGRYAFTASGTLLGYNNNRGPERILAMLRDALAKFEALSAEEDRARVSDGEKWERDKRFARNPPKNGAVIKVFYPCARAERAWNGASAVSSRGWRGSPRLPPSWLRRRD